MHIIKIIVLITFVYSILNLNKKHAINKKVLQILTLTFLVELVNSTLLFFDQSIGLSLNVYQILFFLIWFLLLSTIFNLKPQHLALFISPFILFSILNIIFFEGLFKFNYQTFVFGSILYLLVFIIQSFAYLQKEELTLFTSNNFLLLCAPLLFFIGMSFMFAFESKEVTSTLIYGDIKLYNCICFFVNIVYYSLLCLYIFKERKLQHG